MNSIQSKKKSKATIVTTVVSCHRVPKPLRNFKLKQGSKKQPASGRKSLESSSSFLSSGTSSLHTNSSETPSSSRVLPPDEYYDYGDKDHHLDPDDGLGRSSESCLESPSGASSADPEARKSITPSDKGTSTTTATNRRSVEGDSGHGDFEEELQFSSISSPSQFDPITETESDSCSYTYSYYTCSNSCCSGSYTDDDEEYSFSRTDSDESYGDDESDHTELQGRNEAAAERVAALAAQAALSKSYRAYFKRVEKLKRTLENWDNFLKDNGISRPDFFCRYKERESLQQIVDEFNEVTKRHREGILGALRSAAGGELNDGRSISTTGSESNVRKNVWRTKRIRKLLAVGTLTPEGSSCASRNSGNGKQLTLSVFFALEQNP